VFLCPQDLLRHPAVHKNKLALNASSLSASLHLRGQNGATCFVLAFSKFVPCAYKSIQMRTDKPEKRTKLVKARLTETEYKQLLSMEKQLSITRTEIIRNRLFKSTNKVLVNAMDLLGNLDAIGTELGRCGNNINQLARHANVLNKQGLLSAEVVDEFNRLFTEYITTEREVEKCIRQLIRLMGS
jgi:hypothetical protein